MNYSDEATITVVKSYRVAVTVFKQAKNDYLSSFFCFFALCRRSLSRKCFSMACYTSRAAATRRPSSTRIL